MNKKNLIYPALLLCLYLLPNPTFAQSQRLTRSHENWERLTKINPTLAKKQDSMETVINTIYNENHALEEITIPIIFHVFYDKEEEKLNLEDVSSQMQAINLHYGEPLKTLEHGALIGEQFAEKARALDIKFCVPLPTELPLNISAINFYPTVLGDIGLGNEEENKQKWKMDDSMKRLEEGGVPPVEPDKYLNIWVVDLEEGNAGYAQFPGGPQETDGIVIDIDFFGTIRTAKTPFNLGGTLTHLIGNYLGLHSLWGAERCADDYVFDTPIHNARNHGLPAYKHFSTCTYTAEMTMNYMDNSDDAHLQFFTLGQRYRAHAFLSPNGPRASLLKTRTACLVNLVEKEELSVVEKIVPNSEETKLGINQIKVFPNPVNNQFSIQYRLEKNEPIEMNITHLNGQTIFTQQGLSGQNGLLDIDGSSWSSGVYVLTVLQKGKVIDTQKIVVNPKK